MKKMSEISHVDAVQYLLSRLENAKISNIDSVDSSLKNNSNTDRMELTIRSSYTKYLLLRDTIDEYTKIPTIVKIYKDSLTKIGDFLVQIQKKITQPSNTSDSTLQEKINSELISLEDESSKFIGRNIS
ncbi:MAG: hypothetical protein CBD16_10005 [Betaproteobacteria bacterium TMED156]|nr:MAG: hypothetical protein CBD16_10005 [Betaproteobacteria bacterium TMED156]